MPQTIGRKGLEKHLKLKTTLVFRPKKGFLFEIIGPLFFDQPKNKFGIIDIRTNERAYFRGKELISLATKDPRFNGSIYREYKLSADVYQNN